MTNSKFEIKSIELSGYFKILKGTAPTSDFTTVAAYSQQAGSNDWKPLGTYDSYDSRDFSMHLTGTPIGPSVVVIADVSDGIPPNKSSSVAFPFDFPDQG